jgi:type II secretory pathway pseudopilin PulG
MGAMKHRVRALTLIEIIIGLMVMAVAGTVLFASLGSSYRFAGKTRNRTAATLIAGNFVEDVKAHNYGQPAPLSWPTVTTDTTPPTGWSDKYDAEDPNYTRIPMLVYGRQTRLVFYRQLRLANGSFVDSAKNEKTDKVTLVIWWREETADNIDVNKSLEVEMGVRSPW